MIGIVVALSVPRLFDVPFLLGVVLIVLVLGVTFVVIYYGAGRPLGQRNQPPLTGPYLQLVLTDQRLLLFDRALGSPQRELVESHRRHSIVVTKHEKAGLFTPQRLEYRAASEERFCEFARSERVGKLVAELEL